MFNSTLMYNNSSSFRSGKENYKTVSIVVFTVEVSLVVIGLIGNSLSFAVTVKTDLRKLSTTVYLCVLAVCDNIVLLVIIIDRNILGSDLLLGRSITNLIDLFV